MAALVVPAHGQDSRKVPISFLPPPLENATYSLGIYEVKSGKLVRRLKEIAPESAFTVGLNGLMTSWDGKDDEGNAVSPGKYDARGYAVGPMKVEGTAIIGNDWAKDDEAINANQVEAITLIPEDEGLAAVVYSDDRRSEVLRFSGTNGRLLWHTGLGVFLAGKMNRELFSHYTLEVSGENLIVNASNWLSEFRIADGWTVQSPTRLAASLNPEIARISTGKNGTSWKIEEGTLSQYSAQGELLRHLTPQPNEPIPVGVSASTKSDRLYLLERSKDWERVRGLSWLETKEENGKQVSTWQTFFERNIRPPNPALGLNPRSVQRPPEINLIENPLDPGKPQKLMLRAMNDDKGSYLTTIDWLRLRQISQRANLIATKLEWGDGTYTLGSNATSTLKFYQTGGSAWDEFSIEGAKNMMAFDAGEFEMTADGEKAHTEKAAEPPDL